jgi:hypothetical protein
MKALVLTLAALLGISAGATGLASHAFASDVHLYPPAECNGDNGSS